MSPRRSPAPAFPRRGLRAASTVGLVLALVVPAQVTAGPSGPGRIPQREASRFLSQASLGAPYELVRSVSRTGYARWIERQQRIRPTYHLELFEQEIARYGEEPEIEEGIRARRFAWWRAVLEGPDLLRQRVAFALSEIFVISDRVDRLALSPAAVASFYDVLVRHAFGNYRDLLRDVSRHASMGIYLSHMNNDRSDPSINRFPDENYGREVMQLFSIGLHELHLDGAEKRDGNGDPISTYGNAEVREFAKVFTGFGPDGSFGPYPAFFGAPYGDFTLPMRMYEDHHEPGEKRLLNGFVVPAGQTGLQDFEMAIDNLFEHPNVGPFLALRLIQRLVTSNPSGRYIERIARVFEDDGRGVRGNLGAVVTAILLDPEARSETVLDDPIHGRLREPVLRVVRLLRTFPPRSRIHLELAFLGFALGQYPMNSTSVFNFFQPDFAPNAAFREAGLVAPEFQITTSTTAIYWANIALFLAATRALEDEVTGDSKELRLGLEKRMARDPDLLLARLDLLLTHGTLSEGTRNSIRNAISSYEDKELRLVFALFLFLISPDWLVVQ